MGAPLRGSKQAKLNHRIKAQEEISAADFAAALLKIKGELGLSWAQAGERAGRSAGALSSYVHSPRTWVSKEVAEDILRRIAGESLPPTPRQQAEYTVLARKTQSDIRSETLRENKLADRKARVAELRRALG